MVVWISLLQTRMSPQRLCRKFQVLFETAALQEKGVRFSQGDIVSVTGSQSHMAAGPVRLPVGHAG